MEHNWNFNNYIVGSKDKAEKGIRQGMGKGKYTFYKGSFHIHDHGEFVHVLYPLFKGFFVPYCPM